jgi:ribosomal protein S18 acetylase RimI-like enzyme
MSPDAVPSVQVVQLSEERSEDVASVIARAFQDDPLCVAASPDPAERALWLRYGFRMGMWMGFRFGHVLGTAGQLDGVAVMVAPDAGMLTEEEMAGLGYERGRERVGAELWDRSRTSVLVMLESAEEVLQRAVPEPHWYLDAIAVEPERQGRGIGSALLDAVHARIDAEGVPIVLLTYQPKNLALYQRHGYDIVCEGIALGSETRWWGMRRNPSS